MKKVLLGLIILMSSMQMMAAEGWPAKYQGVMLQGFYWDSYSDTSWKNLTAQADVLSHYFSLIWVPNSAWCKSNTSMGYSPIYWFNQQCAFGTENRLREMIQAYKDRGVGIIEDVVINHKNGVSSWCDLASETWNGNKITWSLADICNTDECVKNGYAATGAADSGEDFDGCRDLDHTSTHVQDNVKVYLDFLLNDLGYAGFRYDMVKGYDPKYTKLYNESANPKFSVGEYWDGSYSTLKWWVNATGNTSAVFDFALKYRIKEAFGNDNWSALSDKGMAGDSGESGMCRYAVTFVDNHDTGQDSNADCLKKNVLAANALILAMPGTPCIFYPHWKQYKREIGHMILARNAAGIHNQSSIISQGEQGGGYIIKTQGTNGSVMVICGYVENADVTGYKLISTGTNYAYYVSDNVTVNYSDDDFIDNTKLPDCATYIDGKLFCYLEADNDEYTAPNAWVWNAANSNYNFTGGTWPGEKLTKVGTTSTGNKVWLWEGPAIDTTNMPTGVVFSTGTGSPQTNDFDFVNGGYYNTTGLTGTITNGIEEVKVENQTDCRKYIDKGQMRIQKGDKIYNALGQEQ